MTESSVHPFGLQTTRRTFLLQAASAAALAACGGADRSPDGHATPADTAGTANDAGASLALYIGTYTKSGASRGIYRTTVAPDTLAFGALELVVETPEPSYFAFTRDGNTLVAVNELLMYEGAAAGSVSAFIRDTNGTWQRRGASPSSKGAAPCYVTIDGSGRHVLVANYMGGNLAVLPLRDDGSLSEATQVIAHTGQGPVTARQQSPHAHCIVFDANDRFAVSADLGADRLFVYRFDATAGTLTPAATPFVATAPGAGPRHVGFSPDGRTLYCANELDNTLTAYAYDANTGALSLRHTVSTRPAAATGTNAPADIHVHPNGRTVYLSNRGDNTIAVFRIDGTSGAPILAQTIASGGNWPRNFTLTPDGRALLVSHQRSDDIVAFRIDEANGQLTAANQRLTAPVPVCLRFA